jgi:hypothetical protein
MSLNSIDKEQPTKKLVDVGRKAADEVVNEGYPVSNVQSRETFIGGED